MAEHTCPGLLNDPPELQLAIDEGGFWMGCEYPERQADVFMVTVTGCRGCELAAEAAARSGVPSQKANTLEGCFDLIARRI